MVINQQIANKILPLIQSIAEGKRVFKYYPYKYVEQGFGGYEEIDYLEPYLLFDENYNHYSIDGKGSFINLDNIYVFKLDTKEECITLTTKRTR